MSKFIFALLLFALFKTNAQTAKFGGTYSRGKDGATGFLALYPESNFNVLFYLEDWRPGDNNSGSICGRMVMKDKDSAVFHFIDTSLNCMLSFQFKTDEIIINAINGKDDCSYGYDVLPEGVYDLNNKNAPQYFINRSNDTTYFTKLVNLPLDSLDYYR